MYSCLPSIWLRNISQGSLPANMANDSISEAIKGTLRGQILCKVTASYSFVLHSYPINNMFSVIHHIGLSFAATMLQWN